MTVTELMNALRRGHYTSVGGYPLYFLASDGEALSFASVRENIFEIGRATRDDDGSGWAIAAVGVNWEDTDMRCAHSGELIESAYGDA